MIPTFLLDKMSRDERQKLTKRSEVIDDSLLQKIKEVINFVRDHGDKALIELTEKYDNVTLQNLEIDDTKITDAYNEIPESQIKALERLFKQLFEYNTKFFEQFPTQFEISLSNNVKITNRWMPLDRIGIYIPGGKARYPSTVLMATVPAIVAGVKEIVLCSPPAPSGLIDRGTLAAIYTIKSFSQGKVRVFSVGGSQAIAAMAYGTESIPRVSKILGPGGIYPTVAKYAVSGDIGIDMLAGPSEVIIFATDETTDPVVIACELFAQSEHGNDSAAICITTSKELVEKIGNTVEELIKDSPRRQYIEDSLRKFGAIIITKNTSQAVEFINEYAPEHLLILSKDPKSIVKSIKNAGSVLVNTPVPFEDYGGAGSNHILPTGKVAKWRTGLSVLDCGKFVPIVEAPKSAIEEYGPIAKILSEMENLPAHYKCFEY
jgi:histidinol dehydrogenase